MAIQGNVESRLELRGATLLVTRYSAKTTLKSHTHRDPYVSIVMCGSYTEVRGTAALLCGPGTVLLHDSREVHADFFIEPARLLNIEVGDAQRDRSMATAVESIAASAHCPRAVRAILQRAYSSLRSESSGRTAPAWLDAAVEGLGARGGHIRGVADRIGVHPTPFRAIVQEPRRRGPVVLSRPAASASRFQASSIDVAAHIEHRPRLRLQRSKPSDARFPRHRRDAARDFPALSHATNAPWSRRRDRRVRARTAHTDQCDGRAFDFERRNAVRRSTLPCTRPRQLRRPHARAGRARRRLGRHGERLRAGLRLRGPRATRPAHAGRSLWHRQQYETFVVTVLLQLVDEGKLKLDDPLSRFALGVSIPNAANITVRELMEMRSGLFKASNMPEIDKMNITGSTKFRPENPHRVGRQPEALFRAGQAV